MHRTKIDWADYVWNPITGCLHSCEYCYARKQTVRFSGDVRLNMTDERCKRYQDDERLFVLDEPFITRNNRSVSYPFGFAPTLHKYRMKDLASRKNGANIFVCSMSDLFGDWVPDEWIEMVFKACAEHPKHNYLFLTKNPKRYFDLAKAGKLPTGENMWYGSTITDEYKPYFHAEEFNCFLSIEPIFSSFDDGTPHEHIKWIIVGAETGNRKGKVAPEKLWIHNLMNSCKQKNIPLFMKDSLEGLMGEEFSQCFPDKLGNEKPLSASREKQRMINCLECKKYGKKAEMNSVTLRKGRRGQNKTIGYFCDSCLAKLSKKWGVDDEEHIGD
ncbi:DUF5131 family protein [Anaerovorax sp. IOR16]|uniref:DUF5131 family protein n=1 Tax=Anaerovorax sp. IOR16 TaxID=2773458 RepID=UPI0019D24C19|nr:DUF5131 family protein [Anaerovorax sp. IOR16]